jgi:hypothetical protein
MFRFLDTVTGGGPTRSMSRGLVFLKLVFLPRCSRTWHVQLLALKTRRRQANTVIHTAKVAASTTDRCVPDRKDANMIGWTLKRQVEWFNTMAACAEAVTQK